MNKEALQLIYQRRSIREFKPDQITNEQLDAVLKAGVLAPSAMNEQTPVIVAVQSQIYRDAVVELKSLGSDKDPFYGAPTIVIVFVPKRRYAALENAVAAQMNMMNAATAAGLASCWVHMPKEIFNQMEGKQLMYAWGLPDNMISVSAMAIGYQAGETPEIPERKKDYIIRV